MMTTFKVECPIGNHRFIIRALYTLTNNKVFGQKKIKIK